MANLMIVTPDYIDALYAATFSGGDWDLPLTNLRAPELYKVARSTDVLVTSTKLDVDLLQSYYAKVVAIPRHNFSLDAQVRVRASNVADFSVLVYDSDWLEVFPEIYPAGVLQFGHPAFWTGRLPSPQYDGYPIGFTHVMATPQNARYWRIEIDDTANADGYVELARLVIGFAYQSTINMAVGAKIGWQDDSTFSETDGGPRFYDERAKRRAVAFTIPILSVDEALVHVLDIQRKYGTTKSFFFVFDPADTYHMHRRAFLGTMRELSPLEYAYSNYMSAAFVIEEVL